MKSSHQACVTNMSKVLSLAGMYDPTTESLGEDKQFESIFALIESKMTLMHSLHAFMKSGLSGTFPHRINGELKKQLGLWGDLRLLASPA